MGLATSLIGGGLGLIGGIVSGIIANKAHKKYANELMGVNMPMPQAIGQAEGIYSNLADQNMPGYQNMLLGIDSGTASTMTQAEQLSSSPAGLLDMLAKATAGAQGNKNQLGIRNADYRTRMLQGLGGFLSGVKTPAEQAINQFNVDKKISAMKERMLGTQQLMQGITGGLGAAFSNFGAGQKLSYQNKTADAFANYFGQGNSSSGLSANDISSIAAKYGMMVG